jgi:methyl-accepting chemotaxis protein
VGAIRAIGATIARISEITASIAAAVEEQGAATIEIARNVQEAARSTQEVTDNIGGVRGAAAETGLAADMVLRAAGMLTEQAGGLNREVESFIGAVKKA